MNWVNQGTCSRVRATRRPFSQRGRKINYWVSRGQKTLLLATSIVEPLSDTDVTISARDVGTILCRDLILLVRNASVDVVFLLLVALANSFIVSRVDYCNSLLAGLPICQLDRIQSVLNAAARLIYGRTPSDHVTDLLRDNLHWLCVPQCITYKLSLIAYKAIHNSMPDYITNFCISAADNRLRSSAKNLLED